MTTLHLALEHRERGQSPVAFRQGTKDRPLYGGWRQYQHVQPSVNEVKAMFTDTDANIALMGGAQNDQNSFTLYVDVDGPTQAETFERLLRGYGIETWIVQRDRFEADDPHANGKHYYFLANAPVKSKHCEFGEIKARGALVIGAGSQHPSGAVYQFVSKPPEIFKLSLSTIPELELSQATGNYRPDLSRKAMQLLDGDPETVKRYDTRSEAEAALIASLIVAGRTFDEILGLFIKSDGPGHFAELYYTDPQDAKRYLYRTYRQEQEWLNENAQNNALELASRMRQYANDHTWRGRGSKTDKAILLAHAAIIARCGKTTYAASCRDLAELAGVNSMTATHANHRLIDARLLVLEQPATVSLATVYSVSLESVSSLYTPSYIRDGVYKDGKSERQTAHDAFHFTGLGKTGAEIYYTLLELNEATPGELIKNTGCSRMTVYRKLDVMERYQMAEKIGRGKWRALEVNLDVVAKLLNTAGKGEQQRREHVQQRRLQKILLKRGLVEG